MMHIIKRHKVLLQILRTQVVKDFINMIESQMLNPGFNIKQIQL